MRSRSIVVLMLLATGLCWPLHAADTSIEKFAELWKKGKIAEAVKLRARQLEFAQAAEGAIFGQIVRDDGKPLTQLDRDDISVYPRILAFNDYWSPEGYFFLHLPPGRYLVRPRGSQWSASVAPAQVAAHTVHNLGVITLHRRDLSSVPQTKVRLNVKRANGSAAGIRVLVDKLDKSPFEGTTAADGSVEIAIPRLAGRWRATSEEPGYAEVWDFFNVNDGTQVVELGRFEITRLKQVSIRWLMPGKAKSNRFVEGENRTGSIVLKSYDKHESAEGVIGRELSFATGEMIDVNWGVQGDLELIQSGSGEVLVEVEPGLKTTTLLEFFPGTFIRGLDKSNQAAMCDLGEVLPESIKSIPVDKLRPHTERGDGLPVLERHTYGLRSHDGQRYVLIYVEKIEDQPLPLQK